MRVGQPGLQPAAIMRTTAKLLALGLRARSKKGLVIDRVQKRNLGPFEIMKYGPIFSAHWPNSYPPLLLYLDEWMNVTMK